MKTIVSVLLLLESLVGAAQPSLVLTKQRPPDLDVSTYKQIAIGDIVGSLGQKNEQSLDLTDALTAKLFNANTLEIIDRNALDVILGTQKYRDLQMIDEETKQLLNKKLKNALLISGRIQSPTLQQNLLYQDQAVVVNGCNRMYYYQVKGDITVQLKVFDLRSGKLIYSNPVIRPVDIKTKAECQVPNKLDLAAIARETIKDISVEVAKLVVPYEKKTLLQFRDPGLFKSPFRQLKEAVGYLQINNTEPGLDILKRYTESKEVKDKNRDDAWYNYGLGLVYAGKFAEAKTALQMSASLSSVNVTVVTALISLMDEEDQVARKMASLEAARRTMVIAEQAAQPPAEEKFTAPADKKPAGKAPAKSAVKKKS